MNKESTPIIKNHYRQFDNLSLSDEHFEQMWQRATRPKPQVKFRYYAAVATVAVLMSVGGSVASFQISQYAKTQYELGQQVLQQVSNYLNVGGGALANIQHLEYLSKTTESLSIVDKELSKMKPIENFSIFQDINP